jgi:predicted esterase
MRRCNLRLLFFVTVSLVLASCGEKPGPSSTKVEDPNPYRAGEKPAPPFQLAVPAVQPAQLDGKDLRKLEEGQLASLARQATARQDYARAATLQYWLVEKTKSGQYDLACYLARIGKTEEALYWLQVAALDEGVDSSHAEHDEDLVTLHRDARWARVRQYLAACNRYFEATPNPRTELILPNGYKKGTPIPAVVWMHGLGSHPGDFVNAGCRGYADELNVAFVGVSGTQSRGPRRYVWSEDPEQDAKRVREALAEVKDRVTIKPGHVITMGFSQGAQMGLEIAVRYPEEYAGAIVMSPGAQSHLNQAQVSPLLARRGFVVVCGAKEHPGNVKLTADAAAWLRAANAQVKHKPYPGMAAHSFPPDFDERFPEWVKFIEASRGQ